MITFRFSQQGVRRKVGTKPVEACSFDVPEAGLHPKHEPYLAPLPVIPDRG